MAQEHVIFAPHPDDELIGCFDIIRRPWNVTIVYPKDTPIGRVNEGRSLIDVRTGLNICVGICNFVVKHQNGFPGMVLHFPHPLTETHPLHREVAMVGEQIARQGKGRVVWYTTQMNVPWIYEVRNPDYKKTMLNTAFPSMKTHWATDHRYFLFEGHVEWHVADWRNWRPGDPCHE